MDVKIGPTKITKITVWPSIQEKQPIMPKIGKPRMTKISMLYMLYTDSEELSERIS